MVDTRNTVNRALIREMNLKNHEANSGNDKEISHSSVTTSSSLLRTPTNNQKIKFEKYMRKSCAF